MAQILIVDDDRDLAEAVADLLQADGHVVRTASNGRAGLQKVYELPPDLILLDVEMPILDGPAMIRRLAPLGERGETVPILLMSGSPALPQIAATLGMPHSLRKPFSWTDLIRSVTRALAGSSPPPTRLSDP